MDINEIWIVGSVLEYDRPITRTGKPMSRLRIRCEGETIAVIGFDDLAKRVFKVGDRVDVVGRIQSTNYTGKDDLRRHGFHVVAESLAHEQEARDQK